MALYMPSVASKSKARADGVGAGQFEAAYLGLVARMRDFQTKHVFRDRAWVLNIGKCGR